MSDNLTYEISHSVCYYVYVCYIQAIILFGCYIRVMILFYADGC